MWDNNPQDQRSGCDTGDATLRSTSKQGGPRAVVDSRGAVVTLEDVSVMLEEEGVGRLLDPRAGVLQAFFPCRNFTVALRVTQPSPQFMLFVVPSIAFANNTPRIETVSRGLLQLNSQVLGVGAFACDITSGEITFSYGLDVGAVEIVVSGVGGGPETTHSHTSALSPKAAMLQHISATVRRLVDTVNHYYPVIMKLLWTDDPLASLINLTPPPSPFHFSRSSEHVKSSPLGVSTVSSPSTNSHAEPFNKVSLFTPLRFPVPPKPNPIPSLPHPTTTQPVPPQAPKTPVVNLVQQVEDNIQQHPQHCSSTRQPVSEQQTERKINQENILPVHAKKNEQTPKQEKNLQTTSSSQQLPQQDSTPMQTEVQTEQTTQHLSASEIVGRCVLGGGPTWMWGKQGCKSSGVVLKVHSPGWVKVLWNTGEENVYRWGNGKYDLVLLSEVPTSACMKGPLGYPLAYLNTPPLGLIGKKVKRGPNWQWGNQGEGYGIVTAMTKTDGWVKVKWSNGQENRYRWGASGAYDIIPVDGEGNPLSSELSPPPPSKKILLERVRGHGPSWKWGTQGGGGGGYVVKLDESGWVRVAWDDGTSNLYRWGGRHFDLILIEEERKVAVKEAHAFLCITHSRLGQHSSLAKLAPSTSQHIVMLIMSFVMPPPDDLPIPSYDQWKHIGITCTFCSLNGNATTSGASTNSSASTVGIWESASWGSGLILGATPTNSTSGGAASGASPTPNDISGIRFKCTECSVECNLCLSCFREHRESAVHKSTHPVIPVPAPPPAGSVKSLFGMLLSIITNPDTEPKEFKRLAAVISRNKWVTCCMDGLGRTLQDWAQGCQRVPQKLKVKLEPVNPPRTALHTAVLFDDLDAVQAALVEGYVDERDGNGFTALHYAEIRRNTALRDLLIQHKADPSIVPPKKHPDYEAWVRVVDLDLFRLSSESTPITPTPTSKSLTPQAPGGMWGFGRGMGGGTAQVSGGLGSLGGIASLTGPVLRIGGGVGTGTLSAKLGSSASSSKSHAKYLVGKKVKRGPDWMWGDQGRGTQGTITKVIGQGWVKVIWDNGDRNQYRFGFNNAHDVILVTPPPSTRPESPGSPTLTQLLSPTAPLSPSYAPSSPLRTSASEIVPPPKDSEEWEWPPPSPPRTAEAGTLAPPASSTTTTTTTPPTASSTAAPTTTATITSITASLATPNQLAITIAGSQSHTITPTTPLLRTPTTTSQSPTSPLAMETTPPKKRT